MIDWIIGLSVGLKIALFSAIVAAIGLLVTVSQSFNKKKKEAPQVVKGDGAKIAQVQGDNAKIDIR